MPTLHELKKQVKELEQLEAQANVQAPITVPSADTSPSAPDITGIPDDDPELPKFMAETASYIDRLFPQSVAANLEGAKVLLAKSRNQNALMAVVQDESLPMEERLAAARQWEAGQAYGKEHWASLGDAELVERLSVHPHTKRLQELSAYVCDSFAVPASGDWQKYLRNQWSAIKEFRKLKEEFPLRQVASRAGIFNSTIVIGLQAVASKVISNSAKDIQEHGARTTIYAYAKELEEGRHPTPATEYPEDLESDNLRNIADHATVEQLNQPRMAEWCAERPERERVVKNILAARLRQSEGTPPQPKPEPVQGITDSMVKAAIRHNELQLAKLDEELAKVDQEIAESKSKRSDSTSNQL
jgi:hypothetical protein